jgi:hypothetical protein
MSFEHGLSGVVLYYVAHIYSEDGGLKNGVKFRTAEEFAALKEENPNIQFFVAIEMSKGGSMLVLYDLPLEWPVDAATVYKLCKCGEPLGWFLAGNEQENYICMDCHVATLGSKSEAPIDEEIVTNGV